MTSISRLRITNFRNLCDVEIEPSSRFNLVYGENGSGKSSFLEALSVLCHGKSFRTHKFRSLINNDEKAFTLFAKANLDDGRDNVSLGVQRSTQGSFDIRLDGERVPTASILASKLPYIIIDSSSFALVEGGPKQRREFFDWLVFHVKHDFADYWRTLVRCFKQRNSLLKQANISYDEFYGWDREIAVASAAVQQMRLELFGQFLEALTQTISALGDKGRFLNSIEIQYKSGWKDDEDYFTQLEGTFDKDKRYGYSTLGPHKSDLIFRSQGQALAEVFSRGQIKLFVTALFITKAQMVTRLADKEVIFAIDDLPAELDANNQQIFGSWLVDLGQQVFITAIDKESGSNFFSKHSRDKIRVFHVKHGEIMAEPD